MQLKKEKAVKRACPDCGVTLLGNYAAKRHKCRASVAATSREEALAQQRKVK